MTIRIPATPEIREIARRVVWFKEPDETLGNPVHFLAYLLTYGTHGEVKAVRRHVTDDQLREALDAAPPGVIDPRSWAYWNLLLDRCPAPPMPERRFPG